MLFIVGTGFSGSTLLSFLLDGHPEIASVGEVTGPFLHWRDRPNYPCSCGKTLEECEFWRAVGSAMAERGLRFDPDHWDTRFVLGRHPATRFLLTRSLRHNAADRLRDALVLRMPAWGRRMREVAKRNQALIESILAVSGKRVLADATKDPTRARHIDRLADVDAFMLHLVRDSFGFVSSQIENWKTLEPNQATLSVGIRNWNRMAGHIDRLFAMTPADRRMRVRYEDLCRDSHGVPARIAEFVGVGRQPDRIDFQAREHHIIGNQMRLASSSEIRLDEKWRERLSPSQIDEIARRTAKHRRAFGYA